MKILRILAIVVGTLVVLIAAVAFGARFADGPVAIFPGGPFESGAWVEDADADLSFAADIPEIELQSGEPPTSRTVWILVNEGEAYIPCSLNFPPGKKWHHEALTKPDAVVRIEGKRYRKRLEKVEDAALQAKLVERVAGKYDTPPGTDASSVWFFHLAPAG